MTQPSDDRPKPRADDAADPSPGADLPSDRPSEPVPAAPVEIVSPPPSAGNVAKAVLARLMAGLQDPDAQRALLTVRAAVDRPEDPPAAWLPAFGAIRLDGTDLLSRVDAGETPIVSAAHMTAHMPGAERDGPTDTPLSGPVVTAQCTPQSLAWLAGAEPLGTDTAAEALCLARGFVAWRDPTQAGLRSDVFPMLAPVLLRPVRLMAARALHHFTLQTAAGHGIFANPSLSMLLEAAGRPRLPPVGTDHGAFLTALEEIIVGGKLDWRITDWTGLVRIPINRYLAATTHGGTRAAGKSTAEADKGPNAQSMLGATEGVGALVRGVVADGEPIAAQYNLDRLTVDALPPLVLDADSSAHAVLLDAFKDTAPLTVLGLPGTGKTQTAANLIAVARLKRRRVLVIAPGRDDLDALVRRLSEAGIDFSPRLGSDDPANNTTPAEATMGDRTEVAASARFGPAQADWTAAAAALEEKRRPLARYARLIHTIYGETGRTPFQILWHVERLRQSVAALPKKALPGPGPRKPSGPKPLVAKRPDTSAAAERRGPTLTAESLETQRALVRRFESELAAYISAQPIQGNRSLTGHVWDGFTPKGPDVDCAALARSLDRIASALKGLSDALRVLRKEADAHFPQTETTARALTELARTLPPVPVGAAVELLPGIAAPGSQAALQELGAMLTEYARQKSTLDRVFGTMWQGFDAATVQEAVSMKDEVLQAMLPGTPVSRASATAQEYSRHALQLQNAMRHFSDCAGALGIGFAASPASVQLMLSALSLAAAAPKDALALRCPELQFPEAASILASARRAAASLLDREGRLAQTFDLMALPTGEAIATAAWRLHGTGLFSQFNSEWREARQLYASMRSNQASGDKLPDPESMAKQMAELAQWRWESERFAADEHYRTALGAGFKGLMTDFDKLDRLVTWYRRLHDALITSAQGSGADQVAKGLRESVYKVLIDADPQRLIALSEHYASAQAALKPLLSVTEPRRRIEEDQRRAEVVKRASFILSELGVMADARIGDVFSTLEGVLTAQSLKHKVENDPRAGSLLRGRYRGIETDFGPVEAVRAWAESVTRVQGLPQKLALWLLTPDAERNAAWLMERLEAAAQHFALYRQQRESLAQYGTVDWERFTGIRGAPAGDTAAAHSQPTDTRTLTDMAARISAARAAIDLLPQYAALLETRRKLVTSGLAELVRELEAGSVPPGRAERMLEYAYAATQADDMLRSWPELAESERLDMAALRRSYAEKHRDWLDATRALIRATASTGGDSPVVLCPAGDVEAALGRSEGPFDMVLVMGAERLTLDDALPALLRGQQPVIFGNPATIETDRETGTPLLVFAAQAFRPAQVLRWDHRTRADGLAAPLSLCPTGDLLVRFPGATAAKTQPSIVVERARHVTPDDAILAIGRMTAEHLAEASRELGRPSPGQIETMAVLVENPALIGAVRRTVRAAIEGDASSYAAASALAAAGEPILVLASAASGPLCRDRILFLAAGSGTTDPESEDGGEALETSDKTRRDSAIQRGFGHARRHLTIVGVANDPETEAAVRLVTESTAPELDAPAERASRLRGTAQRERLLPFQGCILPIVAQYGLQADVNVGVGPFRIDVAVRDPRKPGRYLLGIIGDGVALQAMRATADRELLMEKRLVEMGWAIHRITSIEWFRDPIGSEEMLATRIATLLSAPSPARV